MDRQETEKTRTPLSESLREAQRPMRSLLHKMYAMDPATQVANDMRQYKIVILGISECRWSRKNQAHERRDSTSCLKGRCSPRKGCYYVNIRSIKESNRIDTSEQ